MKYAKIIGDAIAAPTKADFRQLSSLEPGQIVRSLDGSAYRVASKIAGPDGFVFKLANLQGKPVPTPADFRPVSLAMARFASWLKYHLAYRQDFDLYIKSYIEQFNSTHPDTPLPLEAIGPDGKPFRWAKWFQSEIAPKLHVKQKGPEGDEMKDEAIHEMMFIVLGQRHALDKFGEKIKNFPKGVQQLEVARQLTIYLTKSFKFRVEEMQKNLDAQAPTLGFELEEHLKDLQSELTGAKTKKQRESVQQRIDATKAQLEQLGEYKDSPREMSIHQPGHGDEEEGGEFNILEQEEFGVGQDDFTSAEAKRDIARFRTGFARWLEHTQGKKASGLVLLFDLYWVLVSKAGKDKPREDAERTKKEQKRDESAGYMISRGDLEKAWIGKTGLSFGAFKEYLGLLPGLIEEYITSHREAIGEGNAIVGLMDKINQERGKAQPARVSSLNLAGIEDDIDEARAATVSPMTVASDNPPDEGPDYYDFPKNWKEEETEETHDRKKQEKEGDWEDEAQQESLRDPSEQKHRTQQGYALLKTIRPGDRVTILVPAGRGRNGQEWKESTGRAVIVSEDHVALNMGGAHGTPGVATAENIVSVRKAKSSAEKVAQTLVPGSELTPDQRKQVQRAYIYRWTRDNPDRVKTYLHYMGGECPKCDIRNPYVNEQSAEGHPHPTIRMIDDEQWIREHAFNFTNDGRLVTRGDSQHAVPVRYAQHSEERVATVEQKFAMIKAATAAEQFSCCDGWGSHDDKCSVKGTDSTSKHTSSCNPDCDFYDADYCATHEKNAMIGHEFNNADDQAIRPETHIEDPLRVEGEADTTELRQPRLAGDTQDCCGAFKPKHKENCEAYNENFKRTTDQLRSMKSGAGSNSGNDDARGAGDLWRETFYETQEIISPKAMMDGMEKEAQGSGNTTTTFQEQNVTDPMAPNKGQPMAVPEAIDQQAGPHSPNAPSTAPRTPGIQPKIVNVPPGTDTDAEMQVQGSKTADLFDDDGAESSIENDLPTMSPEAKAQWLEAHGWVKENEYHGASWWMGEQMWSKTDHEEDIPYQSTDDAVEKELTLQDREEEQHTMEGTCKECGAASEGAVCEACQQSVKTSADQPYATYDRLKKFHDDWGNKVFPEDPREPGTCKDCGEALNNAEGEYCGACFAGHVNEDADEKFAAGEKVKMVCNECGKHFSVSPNAADPDCPKCGGVDWDVVDDVPAKQSAVNPNVAQQQALHNQNQMNTALPTQGGVSVALMPGQEEQGGTSSGYGDKRPERRSIQPELDQAEFLMKESAVGDLVAAEESKLASDDALSKLAGHFYNTVEGKGKTKMEAQRNAVDDFLYENGRRHSVREILNPKFLRKEPPMGVTYTQHGQTVHDYTKPNTAAPEKDWVEVWEFELHTHA